MLDVKPIAQGNSCVPLMIVHVVLIAFVTITMVLTMPSISIVG